MNVRSEAGRNRSGQPQMKPKFTQFIKRPGIQAVCDVGPIHGMHKYRSTRVSYERDTKTEASGTFELQREDHTVGEPLVAKLHDNEKVHFAACKVPHPLEHRLLIKIRTHHATYTPVVAYNECVSRLSDQLEAIKENFKHLVQEHCSADPSLDFDPASKFVQPDLYAAEDEYGAAINQDDEMVFEDGFGAMQ